MPFGDADLFAQTWPRIVAASVAPVVIISAAALLCLAFYNRLAAIVSRLRAVQRERLAEQDRLDALHAQPHEDGLPLARHSRILAHLTKQSERIIIRARLVRLTLLCFLVAIASLILTCLFNGLTVVWPSAAIGSEILFIWGMLVLFAGIVTAIRELLVSLHPAELESAFVSELVEEPAPPLH